MEALVVQVPERVRERLNQRALSEGKTPQVVALEILERDLSAPAVEKPAAPTRPAPVAQTETPSPAYESEEVRRERLYRRLREEGVIVPLSDELKKMIIPGLDHEKVFEEASRVGGKPLSQIVIEQRQERHDILVYGYKRARLAPHH